MTGLDRLFTRLEAAARRLGEARAASTRLAQRDPARRWRSARLVWPLFAKAFTKG
jgi:hypothetical protein